MQQEDNEDIFLAGKEVGFLEEDSGDLWASSGSGSGHDELVRYGDDGLVLLLDYGW